MDKAPQATATPASQPYTLRVDSFLGTHGRLLHAARIKKDIASWDFKQLSTLENQDRLSAEEKAEQATASDATAYGLLCGLLADPGFQQLSLEKRRALTIARRIFEENVSRPDDDPGYQPLRLELLELTSTLARLKTNAKDEEALLTRPEDGSPTFAEQLRHLVIERNRLAAMRGFKSFYHMRMAEDEMDFDRMRANLDALKAFLEGMKPRLATIEKVGPAPINLKGLAERVESASQMLEKTAHLMGVSPATIEAILQTSDLYPRDQKDKFWYAYQIDPPFDVRATINITPPPGKLTVGEMQKQLLHEVFGHGVDLRSISPELDPLLRQQEAFTAEAIAMLSEELIYEPRWLQHVLGMKAPEVKKLRPQLTRKQFDAMMGGLRSGIATVEFELELYRDPNQDLDAAYARAQAWGWDMEVEDYQSRVDPGTWAVQVTHYVSYPCYCHNYVLGRVWAVQVRQSLRRRFGTYASRRVGPFMARQRNTGLLFTPEEQIVRITGKPLSCEAIIAELNQMASLLEAAKPGESA